MYFKETPSGVQPSQETSQELINGKTAARSCRAHKQEKITLLPIYTQSETQQIPFVANLKGVEIAR